MIHLQYLPSYVASFPIRFMITHKKTRQKLCTRTEFIYCVLKWMTMCWSNIDAICPWIDGLTNGSDINWCCIFSNINDGHFNCHSVQVDNTPYDLWSPGSRNTLVDVIDEVMQSSRWLSHKTDTVALLIEGDRMERITQTVIHWMFSITAVFNHWWWPSKRPLKW